MATGPICQAHCNHLLRSGARLLRQGEPIKDMVCFNAACTAFVNAISMTELVAQLEALFYDKYDPGMLYFQVEKSVPAEEVRKIWNEAQ